MIFDGTNLTPLITEPTRVSETSSSLLNLIFVSHRDGIMKSGVVSDSVIFCVWKIKILHLPPRYISMRQCKNINIDHFIHDVSTIDWERYQFIPYIEVA